MELDLPREWSALCALVFVLGMKHGFDADHLATIDGLTRFNARSKPRLARLCGALFSLGHGIVVVAIALGVSMAAAHWDAPGWLKLSGTAISVLFLTTLGVVNLHAVLTTPADQVVRPVGLKGRWFGRLGQSSHPLLIMTVGALFALSFDTVSQAALFAVTAEQFGGWQRGIGARLAVHARHVRYRRRQWLVDIAADPPQRRDRAHRIARHGHWWSRC